MPGKKKDCGIGPCQGTRRGQTATFRCDNPARFTMTGKVDQYDRGGGEERTVNLCGVHAGQARKGRHVAISTDEKNPAWYGGILIYSMDFEPTPLEAMKTELATMNSRFGQLRAPTTDYGTIGRVIYENADALESVIADLPVDQAQAVMSAVEKTDTAFRYRKRYVERKEELERLIAEAVARGEK